MSFRNLFTKEAVEYIERDELFYSHCLAFYHECTLSEFNTERGREYATIEQVKDAIDCDEAVACVTSEDTILTYVYF